MKLSTVLLSSAALLVAGAAYAADLPAKKAAPAAAPTGCASFGAGYIAIPGGDTCLKISGYVESDNQYAGQAVSRPTAQAYSLSGAYGLGVDTAMNSELGAVKSQILIENNTTTFANASVGGFTAGRQDGLIDIGPGLNHSGPNNNGKGYALRYDAPLGSSTLSFVAADGTISGNNRIADGVASRPDLLAGISTTAGAMKLNGIVASHEVATTTGTAQGYAVVGVASFDAGVAKLTGWASFANGAAYYVTGSYTAGVTTGFMPITATHGVYDSDSGATTNLSSGSNLEAQVDIPLGKNDTFSAIVSSVNVSQGTSSYKLIQEGVGLKHTIAKGLWVRPEVYQDTIDGTSYQGFYIRIERDF